MLLGFVLGVIVGVGFMCFAMWVLLAAEKKR
jgi:hypothetical protein